MNVFCCYIKEELSKKFTIEADVFFSKKKELVHFAFTRPLISYPFYGEIIDFVVDQWEERKTFLLVIK